MVIHNRVVNISIVFAFGKEKSVVETKLEELTFKQHDQQDQDKLSC